VQQNEMLGRAINPLSKVLIHKRFPVFWAEMGYAGTEMAKPRLRLPMNSIADNNIERARPTSRRKSDDLRKEKNRLEAVSQNSNLISD